MLISIVDTETTGLDPKVDQVCEYAAVAIDASDRIVSRVEELCGITAVMTPAARAAHHINPRDLDGLPPFAEVLPTVWNREAKWAAAHNAPFDRGFIDPLLTFLTEPVLWIDTYRCARHLWPDAPGFSNQVLRYWLEVEPELPTGLYPHRALYDALVTAAILQRMIALRQPEELHAMTSRPVLLRRITFGKYRGQLWSEVPKDYCAWLLRQTDLDEDTVYTARARLGH